jgi:hypothetical protein
MGDGSCLPPVDAKVARECGGLAEIQPAGRNLCRQVIGTVKALTPSVSHAGQKLSEASEKALCRSGGGLAGGCKHGQSASRRGNLGRRGPGGHSLRARKLNRANGSHTGGVVVTSVRRNAAAPGGPGERPSTGGRGARSGRGYRRVQHPSGSARASSRSGLVGIPGRSGRGRVMGPSRKLAWRMFRRTFKPVSPAVCHSFRAPWGAFRAIRAPGAAAAPSGAATWP